MKVGNGCKQRAGWGRRAIAVPEASPWRTMAMAESGEEEAGVGLALPPFMLERKKGYSARSEPKKVG